MKKIKNILAGVMALGMGIGATSCTDLNEVVFDRIDATIYYQDENSVKGAVASIYASAASGFLEYFWYLNEFPADQIAWRTWNGGAWGYDEAEKFVLSTQTWNSESKIIRQAWENAWTTIGLCNTLISDLENLDPGSLGMTREGMDTYIAEVRTMRAWAYYNHFELWGGALPLCTNTKGDIPGSAAQDFNEGCNIIYDFISQELDDCCANLTVENGDNATRNRLSQAANSMIKMRLLLNSEVFTGTPRYTECATLCDEIMSGKYGTYELASTYQENFSFDNDKCKEVVFAFAMEDGKITNNNRNTPFYAYNYGDMLGGAWSQSGWNCTIVAPSYDNSGTIQPLGGTDNPKCFRDAPYNDKLGSVYARMDDSDVRKGAFKYDPATGGWTGMFLIGPQFNLLTGEAVEADADREGMQVSYVDQLGTFLNKGRDLETVMSPRWGETNSGYRIVKYPIFPESTGLDWRNIDQVEFRLAEVYYTLAECKLRNSNDENGAKELVNLVRGRALTNPAALDVPGSNYDHFDMDWMLGQWGIEFLNEGRRRRTDLRRFDQFTQGQWWFFGRATETDRDLPAKRDRKYEWYPLPQAALMVNPGLVQNPNY